MKTTLAEWFKEGPFTVAFSSSFFGFFAHSGFAEALFDQGLRPSKVTGSSAGAIVAAALASEMAPAKLREMVFSLKQEDFWDPGLGLGYLRGKKFLRHVEPHFARTFADTKITLEISVFDLLSMRTRFLTQGPVAPAVVASCAVPLMFHPVRLNGRWYVDGGLRNKSGIHPAKNERILCVYLESAGAAGAYERSTGFPPLTENYKILRFKDFPRVSFYSLSRGREAYADVARRSAAAFKIPFAGNFLDV